MRDQREHKCERGWKELELGPFGLEVGLQKEPRSHLCELQMGPNLELGPFGLKVGLQKEPRSYLCELQMGPNLELGPFGLEVGLNFSPTLQSGPYSGP